MSHHTYHISAYFNNNKIIKAAASNNKNKYKKKTLQQQYYMNEWIWSNKSTAATSHIIAREHKYYYNLLFFLTWIQRQTLVAYKHIEFKHVLTCFKFGTNDSHTLIMCRCRTSINGWRGKSHQIYKTRSHVWLGSARRVFIYLYT